MACAITRSELQVIRTKGPIDDPESLAVREDSHSLEEQLCPQPPGPLLGVNFLVL